ncbi:glycosyltransferase [Fusicatenibacter sp.]
MEHLPLISVIVPVYKAELYLDQCVQSIVNQTFKNLEILLVDDGSPDKCSEICDIWSKKDGRIKVIHQVNSGSGAARNVALDKAKGDIVSFVDSDDYIAPEMYEHLVRLMVEDVDIVECAYVYTWGDKETFDISSCDVQYYSVGDAMKEHIQDHFFQQVIWNKLYRRSAIGDIRFPIGKRIDDEFWTYRVLARARKLARTSCSMYAYRQQSESVMHNTFTLARLQAVEAKCQRLEFIEKQFSNLSSLARINLWYTYLYLGQMSLKYMDISEQTKAFEILNKAWNEHHIVVEDIRNVSKIQQIWALLTKISIKNTCRLRNCLKIGM